MSIRAKIRKLEEVKQKAALTERQEELESLLEEIRISVMEFGLQYWKDKGIDLSARDAFNMMVKGYSFFVHEQDPIKNKWNEIEFFKLK